MRKYLMLSKQHFCCNFSGLFVLSSPWRPGRPICQLDYLNFIEGWMADWVGSLQAVETVGWPAASGHDGLGRDSFDCPPWDKSCRMYKKNFLTPFAVMCGEVHCWWITDIITSFLVYHVVWKGHIFCPVFWSKPCSSSVGLSLIIIYCFDFCFLSIFK